MTDVMNWAHPESLVGCVVTMRDGGRFRVLRWQEHRGWAGEYDCERLDRRDVEVVISLPTMQMDLVSFERLGNGIEVRDLNARERDVTPSFVKEHITRELNRSIADGLVVAEVRVCTAEELAKREPGFYVNQLGAAGVEPGESATPRLLSRREINERMVAQRVGVSIDSAPCGDCGARVGKPCFPHLAPSFREPSVAACAVVPGFLTGEQLDAIGALVEQLATAREEAKTLRAELEILKRERLALDRVSGRHEAVCTLLSARGYTFAAGEEAAHVVQRVFDMLDALKRAAEPAPPIASVLAWADRFLAAFPTRHGTKPDAERRNRDTSVVIDVVRLARLDIAVLARMLGADLSTANPWTPRDEFTCALVDDVVRAVRNTPPVTGYQGTAAVLQTLGRFVERTGTLIRATHAASDAGLDILLNAESRALADATRRRAAEPKPPPPPEFAIDIQLADGED